MKTYCVWRVDHVDTTLSAALGIGNVPDLQKFSQAIGKAAEDLKKWAQGVHGTSILDGVWLGVLEIPAEHLVELADVRDRFQSQTDHVISIGCGMDLREANRALTYAISNGGDQVALYSEDMDEESHSRSLGELMHKAESPAPSQSAPQSAPPAPEESQQQEPPPDQPEPTSEGTPQAAGPAPEEAGPPPAESAPAPPADPREQIVAALKEIKAQAPALEALKQQNPDAYAAIKDTIDAMLTMAHGLMQKSEAVATNLEKKSVVIPGLKAKPATNEESSELDKTDEEAQLRGMPSGIPAVGSDSGTVKNGRRKVTGTDQETGAPLPPSWHSMRAGQIVNPKTGAPVSSRRPNG